MAAGPPATAPFDAIVLAVSAHARSRVAGVSLVERGRRVATKAGARRVRVIERADNAADLAAWAADGADHALLVIQVGEQLVHTPLIAPLIAAHGPRRIAVDAGGAFAGALWAEGEARAEVIAAITAAPATADRDLAARWAPRASREEWGLERSEDRGIPTTKRPSAEREPARGNDNVATKVTHGAIARHPATTAAERRAAKRMLFGLIVKDEDGPVTRWFYRPVSRTMTRVLVHTPITPNQVSIFVGILGLIGCWLTARGDYTGLWLGAALVLLAGFIDGCDGEIARIKLQFSPIGAWLDTLIDEATTTIYLIAIGLHTHHRLPDQRWVVPSIWLGAVTYVLGICGIYYYLIVVSKTGNSQHYVGRLELVEDADGPALRKPPATVSTLPPWVRKVGAACTHIIRRDFINLGSLVLAIADQYLFIYGTMLLGGLITFLIVGPDHLRLRRQLAALRRRGAAPRLLAS